MQRIIKINKKPIKRAGRGYYGSTPTVFVNPPQTYREVIVQRQPMDVPIFPTGPQFIAPGVPNTGEWQGAGKPKTIKRAGISRTVVPRQIIATIPRNGQRATYDGIITANRAQQVGVPVPYYTPYIEPITITRPAGSPMSVGYGAGKKKVLVRRVGGGQMKRAGVGNDAFENLARGSVGGFLRSLGVQQIPLTPALPAPAGAIVQNGATTIGSRLANTGNNLANMGRDIWRNATKNISPPGSAVDDATAAFGRHVLKNTTGASDDIARATVKSAGTVAKTGTKGVLSKLAIPITAGFEVADRWDKFKAPVPVGRKILTGLDALGNTIFTVGGGLAGGALGSAVFTPGVGTVVGGVAGGVAGNTAWDGIVNFFDDYIDPEWALMNQAERDGWEYDSNNNKYKNSFTGEETDWDKLSESMRRGNRYNVSTGEYEQELPVLKRGASNQGQGSKRKTIKKEQLNSSKEKKKAEKKDKVKTSNNKTLKKENKKKTAKVNSAPINARILQKPSIR